MTRQLRYWLLRGLIFLSPVALMACSPRTSPPVLPAPPRELVEVKVAVPVPCEIESVPQPSYPALQARKGDDIFTLSKIAAADRRIRMGETEQLRTANVSP